MRGCECCCYHDGFADGEEKARTSAVNVADAVREYARQLDLALHHDRADLLRDEADHMERDAAFARALYRDQLVQFEDRVAEQRAAA